MANCFGVVADSARASLQYLQNRMLSIFLSATWPLVGQLVDADAELHLASRLIHDPTAPAEAGLEPKAGRNTLLPSVPIHSPLRAAVPVKDASFSSEMLSGAPAITLLPCPIPQALWRKIVDVADSDAKIPQEQSE